MIQVDLFGKPKPPPPPVVEPEELAECDHCRGMVPKDDLLDFEGCLMVCRRCYDELEVDHRRISAEMGRSHVCSC